MERPANGLPEDLREHTRLMCDIIAIAFQTDKTRVASLLLSRDLSALYYPFLDVREGHHAASHNNLSDGYERIARFHLSQFAYLAAKLDSMPEGDGTVLDNSCLMFLSNMWIGRKHDNTRLPLVLAGGLGGTLADRPHAELSGGRRRQSQDVQPVPLDHGSHGREARPVRRRRHAAGTPVDLSAARRILCAHDQRDVFGVNGRSQPGLVACAGHLERFRAYVQSASRVAPRRLITPAR